jgi:hypothetical protein
VLVLLTAIAGCGGHISEEEDVVPIEQALGVCADLNVGALVSDSGFAWAATKKFGTPADTRNAPSRSTLRLFENDVPLGPAHSSHDDIRNIGQGRFSHWASTSSSNEKLRFSSSDNSDPRSNGRRYTYCTGDEIPSAPAPTCAATTLNVASAVSDTGFALALAKAFGTPPDNASGR